MPSAARPARPGGWGHSPVLARKWLSSPNWLLYVHCQIMALIGYGKAQGMTVSMRAARRP